MANKIIGNTVGVPNPQTDFKQSDPTKADYLKNSPVDTLDKLERIAHYGDADITPSDSSLFKYSLNDDGQSYTIEKKSFSLSGEIVIPYEYNGLPITKISSRAFDSCNRLKSVTIPEGVTSIGDYAFEYSTNLKSVTIPDSVIYIGRGAFYDTSLKNITIPNGVAEIAYGTFRLCTNLTSITIPDSVIYIGEWAFRDCESFNDVYYEGTKEQWDAITVEKNLNSALLNANIHYDWNPAMKGELSETYAKKEEMLQKMDVIIGYDDEIDSYECDYGESKLFKIVSSERGVEPSEGFEPCFLSVSKVYAKFNIKPQTLVRNEILQTKYYHNGIYIRYKNLEASEPIWSEWTHLYATTLDIENLSKEIVDNYATKTEVGDIGTALDGIIALQNTLMGGGSE